MNPSAVSRVLRFGAFEVDLRAGELHKGGIKIKLQEKPFQVLALLLERVGDVVTREELRQRLWPADTFVDFDHSLGTAIAKLRQALGDSAQNPRFVETVSGRGYRFIAPVTAAGPAPESSSFTSEQHQVEIRQRQSRGHQFAGSIAAGLLGGMLLIGIVLSFDIGGSRQWLRRQSNHPVHSLAVLPLQNLSGDPAQDYFADGMTEQLITNLAQLPNLHAISLLTQMSFKNCIVNACEELDVICSDRKTQQAEDLITNPFAKSRLSKCSRRMKRQAVIIDYRDPNRYRLTIA